MRVEQQGRQRRVRPLPRHQHHGLAFFINRDQRVAGVKIGLNMTTCLSKNLIVWNCFSSSSKHFCLLATISAHTWHQLHEPARQPDPPGLPLQEVRAPGVVRVGLVRPDPEVLAEAGHRRGLLARGRHWRAPDIGVCVCVRCKEVSATRKGSLIMPQYRGSQPFKASHDPTLRAPKYVHRTTTHYFLLPPPPPFMTHSGRLRDPQVENP